MLAVSRGDQASICVILAQIGVLFVCLFLIFCQHCSNTGALTK